MKEYIKKKYLIIVLIIIYFFILGNLETIKSSNYAKGMNENWGLDLPRGYTIIYNKNSTPTSFLGDGERYHILEYDRSKNLSSQLTWIDTTNNYDKSKIFDILKSIKVPKKYYPDLDEPYKLYKLSKSNSKLYIIWDINHNKLYIIENIL